MAISKKIRFEVFKRDKFSCQYCGKAAPNVLLEVDHIVPKAEGGGDDILNLITSCADCNRAKGARPLSDDTVVAKQRQQLAELQERREQLEMMLEWQRSLIDMESQAIEEVAHIWDELVPGYHLNEQGIQTLKRWLQEFEVPELVEAMRTSVAQYLVCDPEDPSKPTHQSVEKAYEYVPRIASRKRRIREKPYLSELYYILYAILQKKSGDTKWYQREAVDIMEEAYLSGVTIGQLRRLARTSYNCESFVQNVEELIRKGSAE